MKRTLLGLTLLTAVPAWACGRPVDAKKVVMFLDMNASYPEILAAERAACNRGERFVVFPPVAQSKTMYEAQRNSLSLYKKLEAIGCSVNSPVEKCRAPAKAYNLAAALVQTLEAKGHKVTAPVINRMFSTLVQQNAAVTSVIMSGHDGGGTVGGKHGTIDKMELLQAFKKNYAKRPDLRAQLHSVMMWGCYTTTDGEILQWKAGLPQLKVVGGFYGSAPASDKRESSSILQDLLEKVSSLSQQCDQAKLGASIRDITGLNQTTAGLYVHTSCNQDYLYNRTSHGVRFGRLGTARNCTEGREDLESMVTMLAHYHAGVRPVPADTSQGELRQAYSQARQLQQCVNDVNAFYHPDRVGLLLFYRGVAKNFNRVFAKQMDKAQQVLDQLGSAIDSEEGNALWRGLVAAGKKMGWTKGDEDLAAIRLEFERAKKELKPGELKNIHTLSRERLIVVISALDRIRNYDVPEKYASLKKAIAPLQDGIRHASEYLYDLNPHCMNFLQWHEYNPRQAAPTPRCK